MAEDPEEEEDVMGEEEEEGEEEEQEEEGIWTTGIILRVWWELGLDVVWEACLEAG